MFVVKKFGCNDGRVCVGNTGSRFGIEVFWITRLHLLLTKNVTYIDSIYSLVIERMFKKKLAARFGGNIRNLRRFKEPVMGNIHDHSVQSLFCCKKNPSMD
jgi:hypothetical protein